MPTEYLQQIAETNSWGAIGPELALGILALLLLALEVLLPKVAHGVIPRIAVIGQLAILASLLWGGMGDVATGQAFGGMIRFDETGQIFRIFFLITSVFVSYLGMVSLDRKTLPQIEYFHILLVVTAALMLLAQANHFVMLFVALETATVGFYILVSYFRDTVVSLEAGLKYLIMGALSSAILLFGIVLLYGAGSNPALMGSSTDPMNFGNLTEGLVDTPKRVVNAYTEFFAGYEEDPEEVLGRTFEDVEGYDDMVMLRDIALESHCEHHMVAILGKVHIAYMPVDKVVGISKLARVIEIFAKRLQTQETMTAQIVDCIQRVLEPAGVAILVDAKHQCMTTRGIKKPDVATITTQFTGVFAEDPRMEARFLAMIGG